MSSGKNDALEGLLSSIGRADFRKEYWNRRALHISDGTPRAANLGVTLASFFDTLRPAIGKPTLGIKAQYFDTQGAHQEMTLPPASFALAPQLLDAGITLCVASYDRLSPPVGELARALAAALELPEAIDVSCYVSYPGRGFGLHFDDTPIFVVQCEGSKRWLFASTSMPASTALRSGVRASDHGELSAFARRNAGMRLEVPREEDLEARVLEPNDLLYLPAGTWHRAYAEDVSVALTFSLSSRRIDDELARAVGQRLLGSRPQSPTLNEAPAPVNLVAWVAARLPELAARASALDPAALAQAIAERPMAPEASASASASPAASSPSSDASAAPPAGLAPSPASPASPGALGDDTLFDIASADVAVFTAPDENGAMQTFVYRGSDGLQLPAACAPMLHSALATTRCTLADLRSWLVGDLDVTRIVPPLVELGVLAHTSAVR
jgi:hypothetical protein